MPHTHDYETASVTLPASYSTQSSPGELGFDSRPPHLAVEVVDLGHVTYRDADEVDALDVEHGSHHLRRRIT
jgi:hypothetical protein